MLERIHDIKENVFYFMRAAPLPNHQQVDVFAELTAVTEGELGTRRSNTLTVVQPDHLAQALGSQK